MTNGAFMVRATQWQCQAMRSKISQTWAFSTFIRTYPGPQRVRFTDCGAKVFPVLVSATSTELLQLLQCFGCSRSLILTNTKSKKTSVVESPKNDKSKSNSILLRMRTSAQLCIEELKEPRGIWNVLSRHFFQKFRGNHKFHFETMGRFPHTISKGGKSDVQI